MGQVLLADRFRMKAQPDGCLVVAQTCDGCWGVSGLPGKARHFATRREAICFALYGRGRRAAQAVLLVPPVTVGEAKIAGHSQCEATPAGVI
jgi:hypothetical protein